MTALAHAPAFAFLGRAGLLAAVLALISGIFGMHVMTATHAAHSPAAAATVNAHHDTPAQGHTGEHPSAPSSAPALPAAQDGPGTRTVECAGPDTCAGMQSIPAAVPAGLASEAGRITDVSSPWRRGAH